MALKVETVKKGVRLKIALTVCIVAILTLAWVSYVGLNEDDERIYVNDGVTSLTKFELAYVETGTSAKGTAFVMEGKDSLNIRIVADIIVGENDTGGAIFSFTPELEVKEVLSSYKGDIGRKHVFVLHSSKTSVLIGSAFNQIPKLPDPGEGTVIMDLQLSGYVALGEIDELYFTTAVGGKDEVYGIVEKRITIPLLHNNAQ